MKTRFVLALYTSRNTIFTAVQLIIILMKKENLKLFTYSILGNAKAQVAREAQATFGMVNEDASRKTCARDKECMP